VIRGNITANESQNIVSLQAYHVARRYRKTLGQMRSTGGRTEGEEAHLNNNNCRIVHPQERELIWCPKTLDCERGFEEDVDDED
jgi:hypothetical protein